PWDQNRDGFVMGEGAGVLVLEELEHALARGAPIFAEYLGGAVSCDAYHMTDPRSDGAGVALCIDKALQDAGITKEQIDYVNAHATSTLVGDLAEINALKRVFGDQMSRIKVNATKSMIGHCLGAAGGIEAIATIKAIQTGMLHPTINLETPIPEIEGIDVIPGVAKAHKVKTALSNSFGFGGHNSTLIFAPYNG
ncbi:MAG TPA: beta-ketoacyl-[acyl-carrier-protein] synthase family protein, partial [Rhabdochlamydiaceae bacterium]